MLIKPPLVVLTSAAPFPAVTLTLRLVAVKLMAPLAVVTAKGPEMTCRGSPILMSLKAVKVIPPVPALITSAKLLMSRSAVSMSRFGEL